MNRQNRYPSEGGHEYNICKHTMNELCGLEDEPGSVLSKTVKEHMFHCEPCRRLMVENNAKAPWMHLFTKREVKHVFKLHEADNTRVGMPMPAETVILGGKEVLPGGEKK